MWELQLANPFGRMSIRKLLTFVAATLVTIFSYLLLTGANAYAADAKWEQGSISYNGETYKGPTNPTPDHALPSGSVLYTFLGPQAPFTPQQERVIYFPPGTDTTTATKASYVTYERGAAGGLSNKSSVTEVNFDPSTLNQAQASTADGSSSCKLDGIGWIICPVTTVISQGMDLIFTLVSGYLKVRPLDTLTTSTMFRTWEIMRNFANIVFVIAFIIVIYSQLTSVGLSNYGIKNILPRLIIASILVNVSYWICAVAIDISNILGYSFQDLFISLRNNILGGNANSWQLISWESISAFILSGGAIAGAAIVGVTAMTATVAGAFTVGAVALVLLPIILGAFITVMVVLLILAARQAIITIFVIISPLAFVAYLLPNTEKLFDKWRSVFMTMLIMFPAFSLIFGGAQLAGTLIIQNAKDINVVLFGMAVQIAPLAITPLLFKLSGSLLGRIAGIINNPSKGVIDRTKNWSKDRLDDHRAGQMKKNRELDLAGNLGGKRNFSRRSALRADNRKRMREGLKHINETDANSLFAGSQLGHQLHEAEYTSTQMKETIETEANVALKTKLNIEGSSLHTANINLELAKAELRNEDAITVDQLAKYRTEEYLNNHANPIFTQNTIRSIRGLHDMENQIAVRGLAAQSAKRVADNEFAEYMQNDPYAQTVAGSIEGTTGAQRALASAMKTQQSAHHEAVSNAGVIIDHGNYQDATVTDLALGNSGNTNIVVTEDIREAAIKRIAGGKNATEFVRLFKEIDIANLPQDLRQELGDSALTNPARPKWLGAGTAAKIKQGNVTTTGPERIQTWIAETINANKLGSAETLVNQDPDYLSEVVDALNNPTIRQQMHHEELIEMKSQIHMALHDNRFKGRIGEREPSFKAIYEKLPDMPGAPGAYEAAKQTPPPRPRTNRP
jgi:hypothetical protein